MVTLAATAYATLSPLEHDDPLSGPRTVLRMAEHAEDEGTRVGLLALFALVCTWMATRAFRVYQRSI